MKKIFIGLLIVLVAIQFIHPVKNLSGNTQKDISTLYSMPDSVKLIVNKACADCHSNKTNYPWYAKIQPVDFWLENHVKDGKRHFNFNDFASYRIGKQNKKLEECIEQIKEDEMPLSSYTLIHKEAILTEAEKNILMNWCQKIVDSIHTNYPADSLKLKGPNPKPSEAK
jgi:hypothetical protein